MSRVERFWFWFLPIVARVFPHYDMGRAANAVYNTRYTLLPSFITRVFGYSAVYLHHFQSDDLTQDFHNHPYERAVSFVLAGGYWEERAYFLEAGATGAKRFLGSTWLEILPDTRNRITKKTFHRIELRNKTRGAWTIFLCGKKVQKWGFWNRNTNVFTQWSGVDKSMPYIDPK